MSQKDVKWRLFFVVRDHEFRTVGEVENLYRKRFNDEDVPFVEFGYSSLAEFIITAPGIIMTTMRRFSADEESALKTFVQEAINVNNKLRAVDAFAKSFKRCYPDHRVPVRQTADSLFARFFLTPPPKITRTCLFHIFSCSTSAVAKDAATKCFQKWKMILHFHSRAMAVASQLPIFFTADVFAESYYSKYGKSPSIGFVKMGFHSLEDLLKWLPELNYFEGSFSVKAREPELEGCARSRGFEWKRPMKEERENEVVAKRMKLDEARGIEEENKEEAAILEERLFGVGEFRLHFELEPQDVKVEEEIEHSNHGIREVDEGILCKEEIEDEGYVNTAVVTMECPAEAAGIREEPENEMSVEESAEAVMPPEAVEERAEAMEMKDDAPEEQPVVREVVRPVLATLSLTSAKYESLGYYIACLLAEAEKNGYDADELAARAIAMIRSPNT